MLALLAYVALFVGAIVNCVAAVKSDDLLIRGLAVGTLAGVVRYGVDSAFHNYLDSSTVLWAYAGLSVALAHLAAIRIPMPQRARVTRPLG